MLRDLSDRELYDLAHLWLVQAIVLILMMLHIVWWSPEWIAACLIALRVSSPIFHRLVGW